jgi:AAA domain
VWRAEADALLGPGGVQAMLRAVDSPPLPTIATVDEVWLDRTASQVIARVEAGQASWLEWHVRSEALRQVRTAGVPLGQLDTTVDGIVARALSTAHSVPIATTRVLPVEPDVLRRADGSSLYHVAGTARFTSKRILDAERRLVEAAGRVGGRVTDGNSVAVALLQSLANGDRLNAGQRLLVQDMATSGRRLQLAIAPAGTGKTTAMRSLAAAWINAGGDVLGLAPSAAAAEQLGRQLAPPKSPTPSATPILAASAASRDVPGADTLAKFVWAVEQGEALAGRVGAGTLVVVDEAGMADTLTLDRVVAFCLERGASVRLVGDDRQLAAVGAGGVLNDIAARHGAVRLEEAVRFTSPAEAAASLALRAGDPGALGFYLDRDRVHIADSATATAQVLAAWQRDVASGRDALMLAPNRALVADLNDAARHARLGGHSEGHSGGHEVGPEVVLADGNRASVGDMVLTRQNNRSMTSGATAWVRNGDRWQVTGVRCDGAMDVQNLRSSGQLTLPGWYVTTAVELGYATTIHGAQGVTADVCHGLVTGTESREQLYTLLTRGRDANHVWVQAGHPDGHTAPIARDLVDPSTATQVLERILATADTTSSATTLVAHANDPRLLLGTAVACYQDAIGFASERHLGPDAMTGIEWAGRAYGLSDADAWPTLRSHLALYAANGHDPAQVLADAVGAGPMTAARDEAAVVDHRLDLTDASTRSRGPLPWLPGIPSQLLDQPDWKTYFAARYVLVRDLAAEVQTGAIADAAGSDVEPYASGLDLPVGLVGDLAIWRAAHQIPDGDTRPTGPVRHRPAEARVQQLLDAQVDAVDAAGRRWSATGGPPPCTWHPNSPGTPDYPNSDAASPPSTPTAGTPTACCSTDWPTRSPTTTPPTPSASASPTQH